MWTLPNIITVVRICFTPVIALLPFIEGYWPKLIAFVIFLALKAYNRLRRPAAEAPAAPPEEVLLLREIRDSLRSSTRQA